jgi:hypothetical protein
MRVLPGDIALVTRMPSGSKGAEPG